ncbi:hypothetical protein SLS60_002993 [Paraconiothyrium brasiliense]|uniref:Lysine-specific metallo-endopeptidase domain-containing protein n=1 Tax=Paraconiothyrium brasiliense TaxID=300254 RepID=A0ABR3RVD3_9PLEO
MVQISIQVLATTAVLAIVGAHPQGSFQFSSINSAWAAKRTLYNLDDISDQDRKDKLTQGHKDAVTIADKALEKMDDDKYKPTLEYWFGKEHTNDDSVKKIKGVFKNFVGDNTDGTGSETNGHTTIYKDDYWIPTDKEIKDADGKTPFCSLKNKDGKTGAAYFKRFKDGAAIHFCDKVFDRANLDTLKADNCAKIGDQVSTKKWTKNFIGANVLHEFMHNPRIGRDGVLKSIRDFAYDAYQCHQLAIDSDVEKRKTTIINADTYVWYALDISFQEICSKQFSEPRDERGDDDSASDSDSPDSSPETDDPTNGACNCTESSCTPDSRACCANNSCEPFED